MPSSTAVSTRTPGPSGGRKRSIVPGAGANPRAGSSALMRNSIAWPRRGALPVSASGSPAGDAELPLDDVDAGRQLADRVLDLQARVQLDEVEGAVRADQELEGAGAPIPDRAARTLRRRLHLLARLRRQRGRGRLLDQLLVAPLDRALALAEREHAASAVAEHLDLDVARGRDRLLDVEAAVAEGGERLGGRRLERALESLRRRRRGACPCRRPPRSP